MKYDHNIRFILFKYNSYFFRFHMIHTSKSMNHTYRSALISRPVYKSIFL